MGDLRVIAKAPLAVANAPRVAVPKSAIAATASGAARFDRCPFSASLYPPPAALGIKAGYSPFGLITLRPMTQTDPLKQKKQMLSHLPFSFWLRGPDLNQRPSGYR